MERAQRASPVHHAAPVLCFAPALQVVFPNVLLRDSDVELFEENPLECAEELVR